MNHIRSRVAAVRAWIRRGVDVCEIASRTGYSIGFVRVAAAGGYAELGERYAHIQRRQQRERAQRRELAR